MNIKEKISLLIKKIEEHNVNYYIKNNPLISNVKKIPLDKSLVELGYFDSIGIYNLVIYLENLFKIKIEGEEITIEKFGSINKMVNLIYKKSKKKSKKS